MNNEKPKKSHKTMERPCMFCGKLAELCERPSSWYGVAEVIIRCENCGFDFLANFDQKVWDEVKEA